MLLVTIMDLLYPCSSLRKAECAVLPCRSFLNCLKFTPWLAFLSSALFIAGLVMWAVSVVKTRDYTIDFATTIGVNTNIINQFINGVRIAIMAVAIAGGVIVLLILILSFIRTAQRSMLWGGCLCSCGTLQHAYALPQWC